LKTKNVLWRKEFLPASKKGENILGGGLAFSNGKLYVTAPYGLLVALDAQTGQEKWRKSFSSLLRVSPIAAGQALFVVTFDNQLYALSQKDGTVHWMHLGIPEPMQFMRMAGASVEGDRVVVAYSSGEVLALNRETGTVLWKSSIPETAAWYMPRQKAIRFASAPLIYRGKVFVGTLQSGLTAFDLKTGDKLWQAHFPLTEPCLATGNMLISVTAKGTLLSLHTENGRLFWEKDLKGFLVKAGLKFDDLEDDEQEKVFTGWLAPRLINGQLYCAHELGFLAILDPQTGRLRMITKHDFTGHAFPIFASGVLHILDQEEELFSFQLTSALSGFSSMPTKS
jgi:outer membrane protein assembly factor BamB